MSNIQKFTDSNELFAKFEELQKQGPVILIFTGAVKAETGESWCPYCVIAKPALNKLMEENKTTPILIGIIARDEWMGKPHPYKMHWMFKARAVPTVILAENDTQLYKLADDSDFQNMDLIQMLVDV